MKAVAATVAATSISNVRHEGLRGNSRIPTSILLIKVITLRTESANLILIDVKLGDMVEEARLSA